MDIANTKYELIANDLRRKIQEKSYEPNEQLPFEKDLCKAYNASRITIRKAMDILVNEGYIYKRRGSGSYVKDIEPKEFTHSTLLENFNGREITTEVIDFTVIKSPDDIAQKLKLSSSEFVYDIYRLRKKNDQPIAIERSFMPIQLIQGMRLDVLADSVYTFMEEELSLTPKSIHRSIRASRPSKLEGKWLQVDWNYPLLEIEQTVFLDNGRPCEYSLTKIKTDEYEFKTVNII
ncbi:GntR family transcriptional regulator [Listeria sp. FSL L7-1485]|uniref:GntR family transcriptional regulator n=1 Tax=Listeria immobilis TaxID=2713502 RepID=A0A7X0X8U5_9LIST|nr:MULTISPECIES: GntR family transcriptional regulator [Listeria]MBC1483289.1 GntR family transcriptional regulator [Listeria immobilis]MBC1489715.1 GntR family transcriptional regulator [Listeria immobilis]MBC1505712.1 GntR family transcriptional regulator [Listeria immobilis]MBC1508497.1 GntR family transcriptional regulator [Listeria immobilis]MBC1537114.1 GntR family transcriptional regulator [Listeria immobilis]